MTVLHHHPRWRAAGRLLILILGIGLTTWGICLIAFPNATNISRLGLPIAAWGVLFGYWSIRLPTVGRRHPEDVPYGQDGQDAAVERAVMAERAAGAELVRVRDESTRREFELSLEVMLRRELEHGLRQELSGLRRDVAELRGDVLDAVDGRLRMERVEITRIIGSNLAALQDDPQRVALTAGERAEVTVPAAAAAPAPGSVPPAPDPYRPPRIEPDPAPEPSATRSDPPIFAALREAAIASRPSASARPLRRPVADVVVPEAGVPAGDMPTVVAPEVAVHDVDVTPPEPVEPTRPHVAESTPDTPLAADPFAGLPRLSSFRMPELPPPPSESSEPAAPAASGGAAAAEGSRYVGRRRHAGDDADVPGARPPGRHGAGNGTDRNTVSPFDLAVGRRSTTNHRG